MGLLIPKNYIGFLGIKIHFSLYKLALSVQKICLKPGVQQLYNECLQKFYTLPTITATDRPADPIESGYGHTRTNEGGGKEGGRRVIPLNLRIKPNKPPLDFGPRSPHMAITFTQVRSFSYNWSWLWKSRIWRHKP